MGVSLHISCEQHHMTSLRRCLCSRLEPSILGGRERLVWSALERQLASLEFCRACRSVSTLNVHVEHRTPSARGFLRIIRLIRTHAFEKAHLESCSSRAGSAFDVGASDGGSSCGAARCLASSVGGLQSAVWPRTVQTVDLGHRFNAGHENYVVFPLQQLSLGKYFNPSISLGLFGRPP